MRRNLITTLFLISFYLSASAQSEIIFKETQNKSYLISYSASNSDSYSKQLLNRIARAANKSVYQTDFTFSFERQARITRTKNRYEFYVSMSNLKLHGDVNYRGFDMKKELFPDYVNFTLKWLDRRKRTIENYRYSNVKIDADPVVLVKKQEYDSVLHRNCRIELNDFQIHYSAANVRFFDTKADIIDQYYKDVKRIQQSENRLRNINLDDLDRLLEYKSMVEANKRVIRVIQNQNYAQRLDLHQNDPANLMQNLRSFERKNTKNEIALDDILNRLDEIYYHKGIEFLNRNDYRYAEENFKKSIKHNPNFAPSHFQLANIEYRRKNNDKAIEIIRHITRSMRPDPETSRMCSDLASAIANEHIDEARRLNNFSKYEEALKKLDQAAEICESIRGVVCPDNHKREYETAISGIYRKIISAAEIAINDERYQTADERIAEAKTFQRKHYHFLKDNTDLEPVLRKLYQAYISEGNSSNRRYEYDHAITFFNKALSICESEEAVECTRELESGMELARNGVYRKKIQKAEQAYNENNLQFAEQTIYDAINYQKANKLEESEDARHLLNNIKHKSYQNLIAEAIQLNQKEQYDIALRRLESAKALETQFDFLLNPELDNLIKKNAKSLILQRIRYGKNEVSENRITGARQFFDKALKLQYQYELQDDEEISTKLESLRDMIFSQECKNLQNEYDFEYQKALDFIAMGSFIKAQETLQKAAQIPNRIEECGISAVEALNKSREIQPAVDYQNKIQDIKTIIQTGQYQQAIEKYKALDDYFYEYKIEKFGATHTPLFDFIKENPGNFINYCIGYYTTKGELNNAMTLLQLLQQRNYPRNWTKNTQTLLGEKMAVRDYKINPAANAKSNLFAYTNGNRWYKYFIRAYKRKWRKID